MGKNPRGSKRSSSSSCSTVSVIVFVAFCLVGLWMYSSSSVIPLQKFSSSSIKTSSKFRSEQRTPLKDRVFEDNPGDLPDDLVKQEDDKISDSDKNNENYQRISDQLNEGGMRERRDGEEDAGTMVDRSAVQKDDDDGTKLENENVIENVQGEDRQSVDQEDGDKGTNQSSDGDDSEKGLSQSVGRDEAEKEQSQLSEGESHREEIEINGNGDQESHVDENVLQNEDQSGSHSTEEGEEKITTHSDEKGDGDGSPATEGQEEEKVDDQQSPDTVASPEDESRKQENDEKETSLSGESFPDGAQSEILNETKADQGSWATQADQSENEKERQNIRSSEKDESSEISKSEGGIKEETGGAYGYTWELCNATAGPDYIPCLDNEAFLKTLHTRGHFEHRERHCPEESTTCLVPLPKGYRRPIGWPKSRDRIWYNNVPHTQLAVVKGHQNWLKVSGEHLIFPGGGTQFIHGALHYIDFIQKSQPQVAWGKRTRVILDVGCGVASFGGYLFERDVLAMSFAPKDEHEAQVQFALERGIPAISAVMGTKRLPFPSMVFDVVHCARCRVPWHAEGGNLLLELNRLLRPGGFFVWSATPVYQKLKEDVEIWKAMTSLTKSMCWELVIIKKDKLNGVGAAVYRKPTTNECYDKRKHNSPALCDVKDDPNAAWYVPLRPCMHRVPVDHMERGSQWPKEWPQRLYTPPYWLNSSQVGVYGKPAPEDFEKDYEHWKRIVKTSYIDGMGIDWSTVRNVMDMRAVYGGFAAALRDLKVWVMNVVAIDSPDTLPIIYERGLFGIYHDWCESFSTYPRTYDLLHADHLFSSLKNRCDVVAAMAEVDRILRPGGKLIMRDESSIVSQLESVIKSLHWEIRFTFSKNQEGILLAEKTFWRPTKLSSDN
ncbi:putative methyltransferase [Nymphaea thermarum]|nr:putative methyltransferase [Nymphaea thermarum]